MLLLCDIVTVTGRLFEEAIISVIDCGGETVIDGLEYPKAWYL